MDQNTDDFPSQFVGLLEAIEPHLTGPTIARLFGAASPSGAVPAHVAFRLLSNLLKGGRPAPEKRRPARVPS